MAFYAGNEGKKLRSEHLASHPTASAPLLVLVAIEIPQII